IHRLPGNLAWKQIALPAALLSHLIEPCHRVRVERHMVKLLLLCVVARFCPGLCLKVELIPCRAEHFALTSTRVGEKYQSTSCALVGMRPQRSDQSPELLFVEPLLSLRLRVRLDPLHGIVSPPAPLDRLSEHDREKSADPVGLIGRQR